MRGANNRVHAGSTEDRDALTGEVIGAAIEVHRCLGPGLLESAYEECLAFELCQRGLNIQRQVPLPVVYKQVRLEVGYRLDIVVNESLVVEVKTVDAICGVHEAQLLTYLRLGGIRKGLLLNFHVALMRDGIVRMVI